ncbi:hypothetical protein LEP1GSC115_1519 [Leptospira interrogans serovar Australis str. 200703203]|uniref:Uncharacterized protein n=1 Tax=Leptospira interrogans serovar Australis str. 200703203 TaxID=1085541 RepID=N1UHA7_LEPIR|nr:hypothetical protein LEP1GSC115_1519 [Leptospira interrogans serovar Australis str. 200703203]
MFNYIILCILVPSIIFPSPVEDFLNPEKKKTTTSSQDTIPKKILRKKTLRLTNNFQNIGSKF